MGQIEQEMTEVGAKRMGGLPESQTMAMAKKVRAMRQAGQEVLSLSLGEPDFATPEHVRQAAIEAIQDHDTHYPPVAGKPELREAAANFLRREYDLPYEARHILVSTGAKQSLVNCMLTLLNPGDEVIIPTPYWVSYIPMTRIPEAEPVVVQTRQENGLKITPEELEAAITPRTRMFLLNTPSNPSGMVYTREELEALAEVLERHPDIWILSDEIYALITFGTPHVSIGTLGNLFERTLTVNGVSKAFSMTGWRIGILAAPEPVIQLCEKLQGQVTSGACSISQRAATAAFSGDLAPAREMVTRFQQRRDLGLKLLAEHLPDWKLSIPEGAFYLYPNVSAHIGKRTPGGRVLADVDALLDYILEEAGVGLVTGRAFGTDEHARISYACSEDMLTEAIERVARLMNRLH